VHKNDQKVAWTTQSKISRIILELEASPVEGQSLQQKERKKEKKGRRKTIKKSKIINTFLSKHCPCPSKNVVKRNASGKKGMLSCCK